MRRKPKPAAKEALYIAAKDTRLAAELAEQQSVSAPLINRTAAVYAAAIASGLQAEDMTAIARVVEDETGVSIRRATSAD